MVRFAGNKGLVDTQVAAFIDFVSGDEDVRQITHWRLKQLEQLQNLASL